MRPCVRMCVGLHVSAFLYFYSQDIACSLNGRCRVLCITERLLQTVSYPNSASYVISVHCAVACCARTVIVHTVRFSVSHSIHASGGATCTINHKVMDPENGRLYTIVSNVGDSPALKIDLQTYGITETSEDQNCDNTRAVERYCNLCNSLNQVPRKVILGRFNFQSPLGKRCSWMGQWGDWVCPYIYTQKEDGNYIISHNTEVMQRFYENAPVEFKPALSSGGPQSLRARPENLEALKRGEFPSANYGSTLEGVLQMPFSMGDKADKRGPLNVKCEPNVAIMHDDLASLECIGMHHMPLRVSCPLPHPHDFFMGSKRLTELSRNTQLHSSVCCWRGGT